MENLTELINRFFPEATGVVTSHAEIPRVTMHLPVSAWSYDINKRRLFVARVFPQGVECATLLLLGKIAETPKSMWATAADCRSSISSWLKLPADSPGAIGHMLGVYDIGANKYRAAHEDLGNESSGDIKWDALESGVNKFEQELANINELTLYMLGTGLSSKEGVVVTPSLLSTDECSAESSFKIYRRPDISSYGTGNSPCAYADRFLMTIRRDPYTLPVAVSIRDTWKQMLCRYAVSFQLWNDTASDLRYSACGFEGVGRGLAKDSWHFMISHSSSLDCLIKSYADAASTRIPAYVFRNCNGDIDIVSCFKTTKTLHFSSTNNSQILNKNLRHWFSNADAKSFFRRNKQMPPVYTKFLLPEGQRADIDERIRLQKLTLDLT